MAPPSPTMAPAPKTKGHHAPYTGTEESRYRTKCMDLKHKITDIEAENDFLNLRIHRTKASIVRMRLERAFLLEKLEEKTPARLDNSDGTETEPSSADDKPLRAQLPRRRRRSSTPGTSCTTLSEQSPPPAPSSLHVPHARSHARNARLHVVMQNPLPGKGRRGASASSRGGARPSPAHKPPRDPNAPKRPTNPFLRFCEQERDNVRAAHGSDENFDLTKAMGVAWHELNEGQKQPYKDAFNEDQKKYKEDLAAYESLKRRTLAATGNPTSPSPSHRQDRHHHRHPHHHRHSRLASLRTDDYASNFAGEPESDDGQDLANLTGHESPDLMDRADGASIVDPGTPTGGTPGPSGASGFTAVNRHTGGLDANMFNQED